MIIFYKVIFRLLISLCGFWFTGINVYAQFYTIVDSVGIESLKIVKKRKKVMNAVVEEEVSETLMVKEIKDTLKVDKEEVQPFLVRDFTTITSKLERRLNMCLPLDFLHISSSYGNRRDPFTNRTAFHDGIDLVCNSEDVYSMLPAIVKEIHRGEKGYGNYVVLNHGELECLYAHLKDITVRKGDVINAGTIVGISGNSGKSTAPHLHIRLRYRGRSVDPMTFIFFIQQHIQKLSKEIGILNERRDLIFSNLLTLENVYKEIVKVGLHHPTIVLSQAILETGYFSSRVCNEYNNLFGLRKRNGEYYQFQRWEDSVIAYLRYVQYRYKGGDYFDFLDRMGYAEDKNYTIKLRSITESLKQKARS